MNKSQLVEAMALRTGLTKVDARRSVEAFIDIASTALRGGDKITLSGFGSFEVTRKPARVGRNFLTGTPVEIPARAAVKFRSSLLDR